MHMLRATPETGTRLSPAGVPVEDELAFRQLRHHTKNALQRIIGSVQRVPGVSETPEGRLIASEVEQAICTSAAISDVLFGLTREPGPMAERLRSLCTCLLTLFTDPDQSIALDVVVDGVCPPELCESVLRVAHEFVGNALKHGMRLRSQGAIVVRLTCDRRGRIVLRVTDDGLGAAAGSDGGGEGLRLARTIAARHRGRVTLHYHALTIAELAIPAIPSDARSDDATRRDLGVIALLFVVLMVGIAAVDALTLSRPPIRSFCLGSVLLAGSDCDAIR